MLADRKTHEPTSLTDLEVFAAVSGVPPEDLLSLEQALLALRPDGPE